MSIRHRLVQPDAVDWQALYLRAVGAGCGRAISRADERLAGPDELLAFAPAELVYLSELATLRQVSPCPYMVGRPLARQAAGVLRLLDRELAVHGRDHGYEIAAWREHACRGAWAAADGLETDDARDWPLTAAVARAAGHIGRAITALHRDRLGVAEQLSEAIGPLLAIYAATADG